MAIIRSTSEDDRLTLMTKYKDLLQRLEQIDTKFKDDLEGKNHHTYREIKYWFENYGEVNKHFKEI